MTRPSTAARTTPEDALQAELAALFDAQNQGGPDSTDIPATFLRVLVTRR